MARPVITLTTDFGTSDPFVGTMKGIILDVNPEATVVDLTHHVPPQDIRAGAFLFGSAHRYFPPGAIHVLVVDPGVNTGRRPLLVMSPSARFIGPDNGLLTYLYDEAGGPSPKGGPFESGEVPLPEGWRAYHLTNHQYWHHPVSNTFHARDIFAPVAGYLSTGVAPEAMGTVVESVSAFVVPQPEEHDGKLVGCVLHVDHFGNLITNIQATSLFSGSSDAGIVIDIAGHKVHGLANSYQDGVPLLAIVGSHGYLEIAAANSNAAEMLGLVVGDEVHVGLTA